MKAPSPRSRTARLTPRATPIVRPIDEVEDVPVETDDEDADADVDVEPAISDVSSVAELVMAASVLAMILNPFTGMANIVAEEDITEVDDRLVPDSIAVYHEIVCPSVSIDVH